MSRLLIEYFCETLAAEGFAVARLDPPGTLFDVNHLEMAADVRNALTWLLQDSEVSNRLNANAVGTMGHSLGGKLAIMNGIDDPEFAVFAIDPVDGDPSPLPDPSIRPNLAPGPISGLTAPLGLIGETTNASSANAFVPACAPQEENFQTFFDGATSSDWVAEWNIIGADHMDFVETCPPGPFSPCSLCDEGTLDAARAFAELQPILWWHSFDIISRPMVVWKPCCSAPTCRKKYSFANARERSNSQTSPTIRTCFCAHARAGLDS